MPTLEEIARLPIVYSIAGMEEVGVQKNGVYRTVDGTALPMDVYSPAGGRGPRPVVILVHGGPIPEGTRIKEAGVFVTTGRLLAASGFVAVTFNHRFYGPERVRDADDDVATLVARRGADRAVVLLGSRPPPRTVAARATVLPSRARRLLLDPGSSGSTRGGAGPARRGDATAVLAPVPPGSRRAQRPSHPGGAGGPGPPLAERRPRPLRLRGPRPQRPARPDDPPRGAPRLRHPRRHAAVARDSAADRGVPAGTPGLRRALDSAAVGRKEIA
jgi:hypothetical protein